MKWFSFRRPEIAVLVVCSANICRSPMAAGLLRTELRRRGLEDKVRVDSAGTRATQPGHRADPRARRACARLGVDLGGSRARQVREQDFERYDYILAMDRANQKWLLEHCPKSQRVQMMLLSHWIPGSNPPDIPDPYYGNAEGFDRVLELIVASLDGFVEHLSDALRAT